MCPTASEITSRSTPLADSTLTNVCRRSRRWKGSPSGRATPRGPARGLEPAPDLGAVHRLAEAVGEDQPGVVPQPAGGQPLLGLLGAPGDQRVSDPCGSSSDRRDWSVFSAPGARPLKVLCRLARTCSMPPARSASSQRSAPASPGRSPAHQRDRHPAAQTGRAGLRTTWSTVTACPSARRSAPCWSRASVAASARSRGTSVYGSARPARASPVADRGGGQPMLRYQVCAPGTLAVSPLLNYYQPAIGNPRPAIDCWPLCGVV